MKVHDTLDELLEDFAELIWVNTNEFRKPDFKTYAESYLSSNSLALGKQKPLAKNKQTDKSFYCEWSIGNKTNKCKEQCFACGHKVASKL